MLILEKGDRGPDVTRLQVILNHELVPSPHLKEDGDFGQKTYDGVVRFQKQWGLTPDGKVGPLTWTSLGQRFAKPKSPIPLPSGHPNETGSWLEIAKHELGVHENSLPGRDNKRIVEYHSTTTLKATDDETPWCSSFVNWVMIKSGHSGTNSAAAKSWLKWGSELSNPSEGAVTVIKRKGASSDKATGSATGFHVAFYISPTKDTIRLLGGNQSDQVKYSNFNLAKYEVKGYRWP
ncbi:MAG: TIGR02594 family protein [Acidobacteriia bacterium]|nr:TIGR02594 family protein [Terriglobia bacterium]